MQQCRPIVCCSQSVAGGVGEEGQLAKLLQLLLMLDLLLSGWRHGVVSLGVFGCTITDCVIC